MFLIEAKYWIHPYRAPHFFQLMLSLEVSSCHCALSQIETSFKINHARRKVCLTSSTSKKLHGVTCMERMEVSSSDDESLPEKRVRDAAAETLVTWAALPDTADARHRFDDHNSDYLLCQVAGRSIRIAQNRARQGELGVTGCCVWDAAVVLARYLEWAEELRSGSKTEVGVQVSPAVHRFHMISHIVFEYVQNCFTLLDTFGSPYNHHIIATKSPYFVTI